MVGTPYFELLMTFMIPSINGLVITKYDYGESIYKFLMDYYDGGHAHWKVPHLVSNDYFLIIKSLHPSKLHENHIFETNNEHEYWSISF
jgi:hypothetical protein